MGQYEENLYCPTCGYNLRGLPGDPVRCPECGSAHARKSLEISDQDVRNHVEYMASVLARSARAATIFLVLATISAVVRARWMGGGVSPAAVVFCITSAAVLGFSLVRFRGVCRARRGWFSGFWRYHALVLAVSFAALFLFVAVTRGLYALYLSMQGWRERLGTLTVLGAIIAAPFISLYIERRMVQPAFKRLRGSIAPFRHDVARELLRLERRDERLRAARRYGMDGEG